MIVKLLGVMDLLSAIAWLLVRYDIGIGVVGWALAVYILVKGAVFLPGIASFIDILCGLFFILSLLGYPFFFNWILVLWLLQKGVFSLLS